MTQKAIHKKRDKNHARWLTSMLMLHRVDRVSDATRPALLRTLIRRVLG